MLSVQIQEKTDRELKKYPPNQRQSAVMAALRFIQDEKGWISTEDMADVAAYGRGVRNPFNCIAFR